MSKVQQLYAGVTPRNRVLEELPGRALQFIQGIAKHADLFALMASAGYNKEVQRQGFGLIEAATGFGVEGANAANPATTAINAVSDWYAPAFERIEAALQHLHPEQADYVFKGLVSVTGVASVVTATVLLDRLDDLAGTGPGAEARKASAVEDKKAMATLAARTFDDKELKRVRSLVELAHDAAAQGGIVDETEQEKRLVALKVWYDDWAATARAVVKKRSDRIKIGLAHRQTPGTDAAPDPVVATPAPATTTPAAPVVPVAAPVVAPVATAPAAAPNA